MESIMDSTRTLINQVVDSIKVKVLNAIDSNSNEQKTQVKDVFESATDPFAGIETEALQSRYAKENFGYVELKEVMLGKKLVWKLNSGKKLICEKSENFVYIPILESIKQFLTNECISTIVLREPKCCCEGVFYDIHDGFLYQNDDYFEEHENILCIALYHDELEVCNPLGSNAGMQKLDMYYYTQAVKKNYSNKKNIVY